MATETLSPERFRTLDDVDIDDKVVLVRVDINSPINPFTGEIMNDLRIRAVLDTLKELEGSKVVLISHQSRPGMGDFTSLSLHTSVLRSYLGDRVRFVPDIIGPTAIREIRRLESGDILLLDNIRLMAEEMMKAPPEVHANTLLVKTLSKHFDLYVNDAFSCIHRSHASLVGLPSHITSVMGRLMERELRALNRVLGSEKDKLVFMLGGAKPEDRIGVIKNIFESSPKDCSFLLGGVIAKVFLVATGQKLPKSVKKETAAHYEEVEMAKSLLEKYGERLILPVDYAYEMEGERVEEPLENIKNSQMVFDVGLKTIEKYLQIMKGADLFCANGPLGLMENPLFIRGTREALNTAAELKGYKLVGGGHLAALIEIENLKDRFDHVSTGGGSLLHLLSGRIPRALQLLMKS